MLFSGSGVLPTLLAIYIKATIEKKAIDLKLTTMQDIITQTAIIEKNTGHDSFRMSLIILNYAGNRTNELKKEQQ